MAAGQSSVLIRDPGKRCRLRNTARVTRGQYCPSATYRLNNRASRGRFGQIGVGAVKLRIFEEGWRSTYFGVTDGSVRKAIKKREIC